jgi:hypothetical protein
MASQLHPQETVLAELWTSLSSLLRSYTAMHGIPTGSEAAVELNYEKISVRHGEKWLHLERNNTVVTWTRENGRCGSLELTEHGSLRGPEGEQAMDLAVESWARELMHDYATELTR